MIGKYFNRIVKHFNRNEHLICPFISNGITSINSKYFSHYMKRMNDFIESVDCGVQCPPIPDCTHGNETEMTSISFTGLNDERKIKFNSE